MNRLRVLVALIVLILLAPLPAGAQPSGDVLRELRKDIEELKAGQERLGKEIEELKALLRPRRGAAPRAEPENLVLSLAGDPVKGDTAARLVLFDFTDYQ